MSFFTDMTRQEREVYKLTQFAWKSRTQPEGTNILVVLTEMNNTVSTWRVTASGKVIPL